MARNPWLQNNHGAGQLPPPRDEEHVTTRPDRTATDPTLRPRTWALLAVCALLGACQAAVDGSSERAQLAHKAINDTVNTWKAALSYTPKKDQGPQTRYCYQQMMDIVCYDSEQPQLTSRLYGYQDGPRQSWIQPGGGGLGASGGPAVSLQAAEPRAPLALAENGAIERSDIPANAPFASVPAKPAAAAKSTHHAAHRKSTTTKSAKKHSKKRHTSHRKVPVKPAPATAPSAPKPSPDA